MGNPNARGDKPSLPGTYSKPVKEFLGLDKNGRPVAPPAEEQTTAPSGDASASGGQAVEKSQSAVELPRKPQQPNNIVFGQTGDTDMVDATAEDGAGESNAPPEKKGKQPDSGSNRPLPGGRNLSEAEWKAAGRPPCPDCRAAGLQGRHPGQCDPERRASALEKSKAAKAKAEPRQADNAGEGAAAESEKTGKEKATTAKKTKKATTADSKKADKADEPEAADPEGKPKKAKKEPCSKCGKYNHTKADCKAERCVRCGGMHMPSKHSCPVEYTGRFYDSSKIETRSLGEQISNLAMAIANAKSLPERDALQATMQGLIDRRDRSKSPKGELKLPYRDRRR